MDGKERLGLLDFFSELTDPRDGPALRHPLENIIAIAICAVICGADSWVEVEEFGQGRYDWFSKFLDLSSGIPAHDTFGRFFARLDPAEFTRCFVDWSRTIANLTPGQVIAIDGKTVRRSYDHFAGKEAIHLVSAWVSANHVALGQVKVDAKSNEITAIPALLELLSISGCVVTIDAMGCQKQIAAQIAAQGGDYVLAVKGNQPQLRARVELMFRHSQTQPAGIHSEQAEEVDKGHGRIEKRTCTVLDIRDWRYYVDTDRQWDRLSTLVRVVGQRQVQGARSEETRYYISSLPCDAPCLLEAVRHHWGIENGLHWVLDIAFREDECRLRKGDGAENFGLLRRLALNLLRNERTSRLGIKTKRRKAGWNDAYLWRVLNS